MLHVALQRLRCKVEQMWRLLLHTLDTLMTFRG